MMKRGIQFLQNPREWEPELKSRNTHLDLTFLLFTQMTVHFYIRNVKLQNLGSATKNGSYTVTDNKSVK